MLKHYDFKDKEIEVGIDEAGKGPVLGSMVYGMAFWPLDNGEMMRDLYGFIDSKQTKESDREYMYDVIDAIDGIEMGWDVGVGHPEHISNVQLAERHSGG